MDQGWTRAGLALALTAVLVGCSSVETEPAQPLTNFEPEPEASEVLETRQSPEPVGYAFIGDRFEGQLRYEERGGRAVVYYTHTVPGAPQVEAELELGMPWMDEGVRRFVGVSERGLPVSIEMVSGPCQMGAQLLSRFVTIEAGRARYEGCAYETGPVLRWAEALPEMLEDIEMCEQAMTQSGMAFVQRGARRILHARVVRNGASVRYDLGQSGRWDCHTYRGQGAEWSVVVDSNQHPGEGAPIFLPGQMPAQGEACYLYERVEAADGSLIGALGEDACASGVGASLPPGSGVR